MIRSESCHGKRELQLTCENLASPISSSLPLNVEIDVGRENTPSRYSGFPENHTFL